MKEWTFDLAEARQIMSTPPPTGNGNPTHSRDNYPSESWDENIGYEGALDALSTGVQRERLRRLQHKIHNHLSTHYQEVETERLSRRGRVLDRQRYRQGRPRCTWETTSHTEAAQSTQIAVNVASLGSVSSDVWIQRGAAVLALIREARRQGIPTTLDAVAYSEGVFGSEPFTNGVGYEGPTLVRIRLKRAGESIAQSITNFALAHAGFFRRVIFRLREEIAKREGWDLTTGYGSTLYHAPDTDDDIFIPSWQRTKSPEAVIETAINWTQTIQDHE